MKLIIAEKPSLAKEIVKSIVGGEVEFSEYYEGNGYIVTSVFGHLLKLKELEEYLNKDTKKWELSDLNFFPKELEHRLENDEGKIKRYNLIKNLVRREDVTEVINSGDADREGEILVNLVIYQIFKELNMQKKITRIWLEDQTEKTIKKELDNPREISSTKNLHNEGLARAFIDWYFGIYLTRYISLLTNNTYNTGRVIIPTVKFIYDRDMAIKNFEKEKFFEITNKMTKEGKEIVISFKEYKFSNADKTMAEEKLEELKSKKILVKEIIKKDITKKPKKLFSLATLQNHMNKTEKFSLDKTLELVQGLYEKKYLTYPRTNTEYLSEEEIPKYESIIEKLNEARI